MCVIIMICGEKDKNRKKFTRYETVHRIHTITAANRKRSARLRALTRPSQLWFRTRTSAFETSDRRASLIHSTNCGGRRIK